jgi:hypothetical protein
MIAQNLLTAGERIRPEIIKSPCDIFQETWENDDSDELNLHFVTSVKFVKKRRSEWDGGIP